MKNGKVRLLSGGSTRNMRTFGNTANKGPLDGSDYPGTCIQVETVHAYNSTSSDCPPGSYLSNAKTESLCKGLLCRIHVRLNIASYLPADVSHPFTKS